MTGRLRHMEHRPYWQHHETSSESRSIVTYWFVVLLTTAFGAIFVGWMLIAVANDTGLMRQGRYAPLYVFAGVVVICSAIGHLVEVLFAALLDWYPPLPTITLRPSKRQPVSVKLADLQQRAGAMVRELRSPKELTLRELESKLKEFQVFIGDLQGTCGEHEALVQTLRADLDKQRRIADEAKGLAEKARSITKDQLSAIKLVITEDAVTQGRRWFLYGMLVSFPIGFVSSLVGSWAFTRILGAAAN